MKGRVVEAEKVCNESNRIRLLEFNAIGFDLIEFNSISFNRICLWTGPAGISAAPITDAKVVPLLLSRYGVNYKRDGGHVVVMEMMVSLTC